MHLFRDVQVAEFNTFRTALAPFLRDQVRTLEILRPHANTLVFGDEFSRFSSFSGYPVYGMVIRAYAEEHGAWGAYLRDKLVIESFDVTGLVRIINMDLPLHRPARRQIVSDQFGSPPREVITPVGDDANALRVNLDVLLRPLLSDPKVDVRLVQEGYRGFNILHVGTEYWAIPQGEGAFDLKRIEARGYSTHFASSLSIEDLRRQIDCYLKVGSK
jgi:hypothetical protein